MNHPETSVTFEIRALATRDSLAHLTELLHRAYAPLAASGLNLAAATQTIEQTRERTLTGQTYVAVCGRDLVGTVTVSSPLEIAPGSPGALFAQYKNRNCCRFHQFAVDPRWRGQGLARALVKQTQEWALASGYSAIAVDMAEGATELCAFYRHMGFRVVDHVQIPGRTYRSAVFRKDLDSSPLRAPLLTLARHHRWATTRMLAALAALDESDYRQAGAIGTDSVHDTLWVLLQSEGMDWLRRLQDDSPAPGLQASEAETDRPALASLLCETAAAWHSIIDAAPPERLHGQLRQRPGDPEPDRMTLAEALLHVFNQAAHYRGRLCARLATLDLPVPSLSLISMLREESAHA